MSKLENILESFKADFAQSVKGGSVEDDIKSDDRKEEFIVKIQTVSRQNRFIVWILVLVLVSLFIGCAYITYKFINNPKMIQLIFVVTGVSFTSIIYYLNYLWRQIVGIEMALAMSERLDSNALLAIISGLLDTLKKG